MKDKLFAGFLFAVVFLTLASTAVAKTWYVNGVSGSNHHSCTSLSTACKTIRHAISLAAAGDVINVAPATYVENLTVGLSIRILGSGASTTIVDGGAVGQVVSISHGNVTLSGMTFRNGRSAHGGAGIGNGGILSLSNSIVSGNAVNISCAEFCLGEGGGIHNSGRLVIDNSTISGNAVNTSCPRSPCLLAFSGGGGISNTGRGIVTIRNSTISGNRALLAGAIKNVGFGSTVTIINSTVSGNRSPKSAAIYTDEGTMTISNSTIGRNLGGGVIVQSSAAAKLQNSIVANNSGANCLGVTSMGYNLSSDRSCAFNGPGDLNNIDPMLGLLRDNGGPTKTMALPSGSLAVDAGNPNGCNDGSGHLLKTDQRGMPRPNAEDTRGCDIGAYELQSD